MTGGGRDTWAGSAAAAAGLALVLWVASAGVRTGLQPPTRDITQFQGASTRPYTPPLPPAVSGTASDVATAPPSPTAAGSAAGSSASTALLAVLVLVAVVVVALVMRRLLRWWWDRPRHEDAPEAVITPADVAEEVHRSLARLDDGTPREAVIACWVSLERALTRAGLPRRASQTASDHAAEALRTWQVSPGTVDELLELYLEARYSDHPLTEGHRTRAVGLWERVRDELREAGA